MSAQPPSILKTKHGTYEWWHQMDYYKNGILRYYLVDEGGELVENEHGNAKYSVRICGSSFESYGMNMKQIRDFADAWDEQVDLRYIDD